MGPVGEASDARALARPHDGVRTELELSRRKIFRVA